MRPGLDTKRSTWVFVNVHVLFKITKRINNQQNVFLLFFSNIFFNPFLVSYRFCILSLANCGQKKPQTLFYVFARLSMREKDEKICAAIPTSSLCCHFHVHASRRTGQRKKKLLCCSNLRTSTIINLSSKKLDIFSCLLRFGTNIKLFYFSCFMQLLWCADRAQFKQFLSHFFREQARELRFDINLRDAR